MPIKNKVIMHRVDPADLPSPPPYQTTQSANAFATTGIPAISTRDLQYFFNLAASVYGDDSASTHGGPDYSNGNSAGQRDEVDMSVVLVLSLFRQTLSHIRPIAERFHLGPADRQPLYALTAQPSPRSAAEFNELSIKRRDPVAGVWHSVCTSDIEPNLDLARTGHYKVASFTMDAVPVWRRVASGKTTYETSDSGKGNKLCIWWGDRSSLGPIGDTYGLWYESGGEAGSIEAFYVVQWRGFDSLEQGVVSVKPALRDANGQFVDPRSIQRDLATLYFHGDGRTPAKFVTQDVNTLIRLDFVMAGLMTVLTLETRKMAALNSPGAQMAQKMGLSFVPYQ